MPKLKFPWRRFWCAPDALLHLEPDGFLTDCEDRYSKLLAPETKTFQEIEKVHCLILLGEPGIGKSTAIEDEFSRIREAAVPGSIFSINLKEYGSEEHLWRTLFESALWQNYAKGDYKLDLFLDSIDEVRIRINNIQNLLVRGLRDCPRDRLFLRIACRTADWPSSFYDQLSELWSREEVKVFELAPLTRKNVVEAAELVGIEDVAKFMRTVHEKGIGALASKPITLSFLLNLYVAQGNLPAGQIGLYRTGCLYLCEEPDKERREKGDIDKRYAGILSARERLIIASRIAAALTFSNSYAVYRNGLSGIPEGCVPIGQVAGGKEPIDGGAIERWRGCDP